MCIFQGVHCLFDEAVMELMWGLQNLVKSLVPGERVELTKENCLPVSQGMKIILGRYGFDLKPEMVSPLLWFEPLLNCT